MAHSKKKDRNRPAITHNLKCNPDHFVQLIHGLKTFEFRRNNRDYQVLDFLSILEYDRVKNEYTGRTVLMQVTSLMELGALVDYMLPHTLPSGYVILSVQMIIRTV